VAGRRTFRILTSSQQFGRLCGGGGDDDEDDDGDDDNSLLRLDFPYILLYSGFPTKTFIL